VPETKLKTLKFRNNQTVYAEGMLPFNNDLHKTYLSLITVRH